MSLKKENKYHTKNLKEKLIYHAMDLISTEGLANFSVRNLSKALKISHNALYRHFKSKNELYFAVAEKACDLLSIEFENILTRNDIDEIAKFKEFCFSYIDFATSNPEIYKLMFGKKIIEMGTNDIYAIAAKRNYGLVVKIAELCQDSGKMREGSPISLANTVWAMVHGISMLVIDDQLDKTEDFSGLPVQFKMANEKSDVDVRLTTKLCIDVLFYGYIKR